MGFTKNHYTLVSQFLTAIDGEGCQLTKLNGTTEWLYGGVYASTYSSAALCSLGGNRYSNNKLLLGTGTNAFSVDDYKLQTDVSSSFTKASLTVSGGAISETKGRVLTWTCSYLNTSGADITVSEIGLTKYVMFGSNEDVLIFRDVLATPVTVPAGQGITVTLTFTFDGFNVLADVQAQQS